MKQTDGLVFCLNFTSPVVDCNVNSSLLGCWEERRCPHAADGAAPGDQRGAWAGHPWCELLSYYLCSYYHGCVYNLGLLTSRVWTKMTGSGDGMNNYNLWIGWRTEENNWLSMCQKLLISNENIDVIFSHEDIECVSVYENRIVNICYLAVNKLHCESLQIVCDNDHFLREQVNM